MSDPVTNTEIEDVLSSIRRLVAGDHEPHVDQVPAQMDPSQQGVFGIKTTDADATTDALVLTPSLRVEEDEPEVKADESVLWDEDAAAEARERWGNPEATALPEDEGADEDLSVTPWTRGAFAPPALADDNDVNEEADVPHPGEDFRAEEPGTTQDEPVQLPTFIRAQRSTDAPEPEIEATQPSAEAETVTPGWPPIGAATRIAPRAGFRFGADKDDDEPMPASSLPPEQQVLDGPSDPVEPSDVAIPPEDGGAEKPEPALEVSSPATQDTADTDSRESADEQSEIGSETARIGSFAAALSGVAAEPDIQSILDDVQEDAKVEGAEAVDLGNLFEPHDTDLDEQALRDLVSEMVLKELQGPLGERITRNVRKLVRREIYRALASRDFD